MFLVVGLGNPGNEYKNTRHNVGFIAAELLAQQWGLPELRLNKKFQAHITEGRFHDQQIIIAEPETFMNDSGIAVTLIAHFYHIPPKNILVIHDDKDIMLGESRLHFDRGSAGHNGVSSIIEHLGTQGFYRLRLGILPEHPIADTANFVLGHMDTSEQKIIEQVIEKTFPELERLLNK